MDPRSFAFLVLLLVLSAVASRAALPPDEVEFFEAKIRPILVESCYPCHSAAEGKTKGSLALDTRDALLKGGATGPALIAGDPDKSLLIQAVRYTDEDLQMPPLKDGQGGKLPPEKIAALEQWIRRGAPDPRTGPVTPLALDMARARQHWAFQPLPQTQDAPALNPIDALVRPKLAAARLSPAPAADPRTLLRRITYDLTGLPPTPAEVAAFLADRSADAYARAVDRLLASPRYGERWGRFWLDVARYADTQGYLVGNAERRFAYSHTYRDYVIRAFNADLPFDQFLVEQLAADQLPLGDDKSALAAMGFLTLGRRFLGNQNDIIDDRIDVVTRGLLGLTVACARCHDHKFDPIPTRDYYALHGIFASSEEPAEKPLLAALDESAPAYREFLRKRAEIAATIETTKHALVETFLSDQRKKTGDYLLAAHDAAKLAPDEKFDLFAGTRKLNPEVLRRWQKYLAAQADAPGPILAPWFAALPSPIGRQLAGAPSSPLPAPLGSQLAGAPSSPLPTPVGRQLAGAPSSPLPDPDPLNPSSSPDGPTAPRATPTTLLAHLALPSPLADAPLSTLSSPLAPADTAPALLTALREHPPSSLADLAAIYNRVFTAAEKSQAPDPLAALRTFHTSPDSPANLSAEAAAKIIKRQTDDKTSALRRDLEALNWTEPGAPLRAMALVDRASPRNSPVLLRGNPANKGPEAPRRFLEVLGGDTLPAATTTSGRLELARALTGPAAPLTARVFVNRVWGWHFGQALVRTPSDFGIRTESPVQRDLLDALAASFITGGWSVKTLHRTILLSATYRQSSDASPATLAADPDNQLLSHFNRRRLEFEALRDTLLVAAGQLDLTPGGLPDDLVKEPFTRRRTVYGFIDRQNLPGLFRTFDFPNPDTTSAQRFATTVPQQSLFLLNSPFALAQARHLAARPELASAPDDAQKIRALYASLYQRAPDPDELALAQNFLTTTASAHATATSRAPLPPGATAAAAPPGWSYGTGSYDPATRRTRDFTALTARKRAEGKKQEPLVRLSPSDKFPDPTFGHLSLTPSGGHPGPTPNHSAILRWTSPADGVIQIEATLAHPTAVGDGVHARIVSSITGSLGDWSVHQSKAETKFADLRVSAGEALDFIVDCAAEATSDTFTWSPKIIFAADPAADSPTRTWDAKRDFGTTEKILIPLSPLAALAQVLLLSNELAFID